MSERPSPTIEDYLGVIYTLLRDSQPVYGRRLAEWMEVSPPTVTATLQRMVRDGWVLMGQDKTVRLTEEGSVAAASVVRRHMLTELLLARVLNVPWSEVHGEADRLEHGLSSETASRVAELLDGAFADGTVACPHGNPLPGQEARVGASRPLTEVSPGREYVLLRIHEEAERDSATLALLEAQHLLPGARLTVLGPEPPSGSGLIAVLVGGERVVLEGAVARCLWLQDPE